MTVGALGDSFTIGACVPSDKNFVALIREHYLDTLNLGMLGEGPLTMLAALKEYLPLLKPKVVLWFFFEENDFIELLQESKTPLLTNYLEDDFKQDLFNRQADIDQVLTLSRTGFNTELTKQRQMQTMKRHFGTPGDSGNFPEAVDLRQRIGFYWMDQCNSARNTEYQRGPIKFISQRFVTS